MGSRSLESIAVVLGVATTVLGVACYAGCESVPDIRFVPDDASSDAPLPSDAGASDASADAASDAEPTSCTTQSPSAAAICCGAIWCEGECGPTNCADCAQKLDSGVQCQAGNVCCGKGGTVVCKPQCP